MSFVKNRYSQDDGSEPEIPTATLQIYDFIADYLRRDKGDDVNVNRASAATMCVRRRWYQRNGHPGDPLGPRKIVNFLMGDLAEKALVYFIREGLVGPGKLYSEVRFGEEVGRFSFSGKEIRVYDQNTFHWKINDLITVTAHVDGLGKRNLDGKWELIEIKSSSDYGYDEFKSEGPGAYINQAHACMMTEELRALDVKSVRYFYLKKSTGHVWDKLIEFNEEIARFVARDYEMVTRSTPPNQPHTFSNELFRGKPTGRRVLPWQCAYCPFTAICQTTARLDFKKGAFGVSKPVWIETKE